MYQDYELAFVFNFMTFLYTIMTSNRKILMKGFCSGLVRKGLIDLENLNSESLKPHRAKFKPAQKQIVDEYFFFMALKNIFQGLTYFILLLEK